MSYQYIYIYLGWLVHHLDALETYLSRSTEAYMREWGVKVAEYRDSKLQSRAWYGITKVIVDGKKLS